MSRAKSHSPSSADHAVDEAWRSSRTRGSNDRRRLPGLNQSLVSRGRRGARRRPCGPASSSARPARAARDRRAEIELRCWGSARLALDLGTSAWRVTAQNGSNSGTSIVVGACACVCVCVCACVCVRGCVCVPDRGARLRPVLRRHPPRGRDRDRAPVRALPEHLQHVGADLEARTGRAAEDPGQHRRRGAPRLPRHDDWFKPGNIRRSFRAADRALARKYVDRMVALGDTSHWTSRTTRCR